MAMHELPHGSPLTQCELARRDRQLRRSDRPHTGGKSPAFRREGAKSRETRTLCWREMDSNHRSPLAIGEVRTPERRSPRRKYLHSLCLGALFNAGLRRGTGSSNPSPSTGESATNRLLISPTDGGLWGIRLPVEAVQGYRQGDGRDKSCQSAQLRRYHRGPDNRPRKESRSRQVPFLKTAPIINWPVCLW